MNEGRQDYLAGLISDIVFAFVTYFVLGTILGICAILLRPAFEPIVGDFVAGIWCYPIIIGYCVWQFRTFRRLRRADPPTSDNPRLD